MKLMKKVLIAVFTLILIAGQNVYAGRLMVTANGFSENDALEKTTIDIHIQAKYAGREYGDFISNGAEAVIRINNRATGQKIHIQADGMLRASPENPSWSQGSALFSGISDPDGIHDNADDIILTIWAHKNWQLSGQDTYSILLQKGHELSPDYEIIYNSNQVALQGGNIHVLYFEDKNIDHTK